MSGSDVDVLADRFLPPLLDQVDGTREVGGVVTYPARELAARLAVMAREWADARAAGHGG